MGTVEAMLAQGWQQQQSGQQQQAERTFHQAAQLHPQHPDGWAALGALYLLQGKIENAIDPLRRALALKSDQATVQNNLGIALAQSGRGVEAVDCFREALKHDPTSPDANSNLGNALIETGRYQEAVACLQRLLARQPNHVGALANMGRAFTKLNQFDEAAKHLRHLVQLTPNNPQAFIALGLAYFGHDKFAEAIDCFQRTLKLQPKSAEAWVNLGAALARNGKATEAQVCLQEATRLRPNSPEMLSAIGAVFAELGDFPAAVDKFQEALRIRPDFEPALVNQGDALRRLGRFSEARESLLRGLELKNDSAISHQNLAVLYADTGLIAESLAQYDAALRLWPNSPLVRKNRALVCLQLGMWEEGWREYEWRWRCPEFHESVFSQPRWNGEALTGKTILLWAEQGMGDLLFSIRYGALLKASGATVILQCKPSLHRLLSTCPGIDRLVAEGATSLPAFDYHAPLMSLPGLFGTNLDTVPATIPYLAAEPALVSHWQQELAPLTGFRIGVFWQGNSKYVRDITRSFSLSQLVPLAELPGVQLVSLQRGEGLDQLAKWSGRSEILNLGERLDAGPDAFVETVALLKNLDLVISCDTAINHLAGALGVPSWLALSRGPDWRWLLDRDDTPWYPTTRLFRQKEIGKWEDVFAEMTQALAAQLSVQRRARPVVVEVAPGELVDKITILEIKCERITAEAKLRNIRLELRLLREAHTQALPPSAALLELTTQLKTVNSELWDVEDGIRDCDREGDFGPRFIELARSVYRQNDRRAALKRKINELLGSQIVEEKGYKDYQK